MRSEVLGRQHDPHVRTARGKGIQEGSVTRRHIVRNSAAPYATFVGLEVGALAGGSIVTESVFNLPGVGLAIARRSHLSVELELRGRSRLPLHIVPAHQ